MRFLGLFIMLFSSVVSSQDLKRYSFDDLNTLQNSEGKKVLIQMQTDWCYVCKLDLKSIRKNQNLINEINDKTYFIPFNPEVYKADINFGGSGFSFVPNGNSGLHSLAFALSRNKEQIVYPIWILLDEKGELLFYNEGKLDQKALLKILN